MRCMGIGGRAVGSRALTGATAGGLMALNTGRIGPGTRQSRKRNATMKSALAPPLSASGPGPLWDAARDYTRVILRDISVEARIGVHPWERHVERPSRLVVNVEMFAPGKTRKNFINYDKIHAAFRDWPGRDHVDLLETLVEEVVALCFGIPEVAACRVSIVKPDIFNDTAAVGIEVYRRRDLVEDAGAG